MPRYAALDIGSNSVRMIAVEVSHSETRVLAEERQVTRLGESVFRSGRVSEDALTFLVNTLGRMAATCQRLNADHVRAVATSAVRDAGNQPEFLERTSAVLGVPVEIISGSEEARLIHLGVEARWPRPRERSLIIDVGGGSAELIVSEGGQMIDAVSRPLGAVRLTELFLKTDPPRPDELHRLGQYIDEKLAPFVKKHREEKFQRAVATSASAAAVVCAVNEMPRSRRQEADRKRASASQLKRLFEHLSSLDLAGRRRLTGIGPRRAEIITAGTAVFVRALEKLQHPSIYYSSAGVRDGVIADFLLRGVGRELSQMTGDQRRMVEAMAKRYGVAMKHVQKVAQLSHALFDSLQPLHQLPPVAGRLLEAASYLHDIGHFVSDTSHHKHSAYLVANSDMAGFTNRERLAIAALCRFHRKSMPQPRHSHFQALDAEQKRAVLLLAPLLRIADSLDRGHLQKVHELGAQLRNGGVTIQVTADRDADLELWAADEISGAFTEAYGVPISIQRRRQ
jgi:exopolyphosphatase / guanosine-5'-triphosphate,3'-diphosphate pyrophosphatase